MYKLYGYIPNLKLIKTSIEEENIINEIEKHIYKVNHIQFLIIYNNGKSDLAYKIILTLEDFINYKNEKIKRKELKL